MRIAVNLSYLRTGAVGGSETYITELLTRLPALGVDPWVLGWPSVTRKFRALGLNTREISEHEYSLPHRGMAEIAGLQRALRHLKPDLLFSPANYPALFTVGTPQVVTVHDAQHVGNPSALGRRTRALRHALFHATRIRAAQVIAVSEFTRNELLAAYPFSPERVHTIHEGAMAPTAVKDEERASARVKLRLSRPYFYYPAMLAPHKAHHQLLAAFHLFRQKHREFELIFSGAHAQRFTRLERDISRLNLQDCVRHLGYVEAREVAILLSGATALVYPSFYEGFGLPLLDAMSLGTPVVSSFCGSLPEVAGGAALLVDPRRPEQIAAALERVAMDHELRRSLREKGLSAASRFSWDKCALQTTALFKKVSVENNHA